MEEILEEQSRFFASQNQPSATLARRKMAADNEKLAGSAEPVRPISKFAASRQKQPGSNPEPNENLTFPEPMSMISLKIVERDSGLVPVIVPEFRSTPFPELALHKPQGKRATKEGKENTSSPEYGHTSDTKLQSSFLKATELASSNPYLPDKQEIHRENEMLLQSMSDAQKLDMLRELQALDPKFYEQMRSRSKVNKINAASQNGAISGAQTGFAAAGDTGGEILPIPEYIDEQLRDGRLCNLPEPTEEDRRKMQWMLDVTSTKDGANEPTGPEDLRFDFDGRLVEPGRAVDVTEGLHHHGEAPDAAGYTVPELARLCRSAFPGQRILAMQVTISTSAGRG